MQQEIIWFAKRMQEVLDSSMSKEETERWNQADQPTLYEELIDRVDALRECINHRCECCQAEFFHEEQNAAEIIKRCSDIANHAMKIADNTNKDRG